MNKTKLIIAVILAMLILLLIFQNLDACGIRFLFWSGSLPRALMLFIALAIGFVIGLLVAPMWGKKHST